MRSIRFWVIPIRTSWVITSPSFRQYQRRRRATRPRSIRGRHLLCARCAVRRGTPTPTHTYSHTPTPTLHTHTHIYTYTYTYTHTYTHTHTHTYTHTYTGRPTPTPTPYTDAHTHTHTHTDAHTYHQHQHQQQNISGTVLYCSNPVPGPVPNVTLTLTGSGSGSTLSDGSGNYTFAGLPSGGNYTVMPMKAALTPGSTGIDTVDVIAMQRHFLNLGTPLSGCRLTAADVNGLNGIDTVDVIAIQRFFLGLSTGIANTGKYQFNPANRSYPGVISDQTGQNYDTLVFRRRCLSLLQTVLIFAVFV